MTPAPLVYADQTFGTHSRFAVRSPRPITDQIARVHALRRTLT